MSDNKLLRENTIRRFMTLANVGPLTDNFISEKYKRDDDVDESTDPDDDSITEQEDELGEIPEEEPVPAEEEDLEMDMGDIEEPEGEELGAADISLSEEEAQLLIDLGERLKEAMGDQPSDLDEPGDDMDLEEPVDDVEPPMDAPEEEEEDIAPLQENQTAIINEVLKRVTRRIVSERMKKTR